MKIKKHLITLSTLSSIFILGIIILPILGNSDAAGSLNSLAVYSDSTLDSAAVYTCPMHPEVISDKPGTCPKCRMDLVPKKNDEKSQGMNCPDMEKCKEMKCDMDKCKGNMGGCINNCPMMKDHNHESKEHDHNSKDNDDSNGHNHKSGCRKGC